jgi:hypothetical protein
MRIFAWTAAFAAMGIFVIACSTGASSSASAGISSSSGGDPADAIIDMYCHTIAAPFCQADYACCSFPLIHGTVEACEEAVLAGAWKPCANPWERDALRAALKSGAVVFDHAQFETCLTLLKSMVSGGAPCVYPPQYLLYSTCMGSFQGQIAPGDACPWPETKIDLDRALLCKDGTCQNGICIPFLKTGDHCVPSQYGPLAQPVNMRCNYMKHEGCWGMLTDAGGGGGGAGGAMPTGTCLPQAEFGVACDPGNHHECKALLCNPTTAKCGPAIGWGACANN